MTADNAALLPLTAAFDCQARFPDQLLVFLVASLVSYTSCCQRQSLPKTAACKSEAGCRVAQSVWQLHMPKLVMPELSYTSACCEPDRPDDSKYSRVGELHVEWQ